VRAARFAAGASGLPSPSLKNTASPVPSITWFAAVPPCTDWWKLSLEANSSASCLNSGASPSFMFRNAIELPTPLSAVLKVVLTNGKRSFRHPLGLERVALAMLQSDCCHIWNSRWMVSPVYAS
jgi:hypothetical protein